MQKITEMIEEKLEVIVKVLVGIILFLALSLLFIVSKNSKEKPKEDELADDFMDELFLEEKKDTDIEQTELLTLTNDQDRQEELHPKIIVDVKGAVEAPGVYEMEAESRVIDCIEKAGGFLIEAEQKRINLAERTEDQMVIYIPLKDEDLSDFELLLPDKAVSQSTTIETKMDLNKATKEELKSLNGIGEVKAENIISYREEHGLFQNIEDLTNVSGIGDATFDKLKEDIQVVP